MAFEEPKLDYNLFGNGSSGDNVLKGGVEHSDFNVSGILDEVADNVFKGFLTAGTDLFFRLLRDKGYGRGYDENFGNEGSFYDIYTRKLNSIGNERHHYYRPQSDARSNYTDMDFALDNLTPADVNKIINNSLAIQAKASLKLRQANRSAKNVNMQEFQQNLRNLRLPKGSLFSDREDDDPWAVSLLRLDSLNKLALPIENRDYDDYKDLVHNLNWLKLFKAEKDGGLVSKEVTNRLHQRINRHREANRLYTLEDVAELAKQKMSGGGGKPVNKPVTTDVNKNVSEPVSKDGNKEITEKDLQPAKNWIKNFEDYSNKRTKLKKDFRAYVSLLPSGKTVHYVVTNTACNLNIITDVKAHNIEYYLENYGLQNKQSIVVTNGTFYEPLEDNKNLTKGGILIRDGQELNKGIYDPALNHKLFFGIEKDKVDKKGNIIPGKAYMFLNKPVNSQEERVNELSRIWKKRPDLKKEDLDDIIKAPFIEQYRVGIGGLIPLEMEKNDLDYYNYLEKNKLGGAFKGVYSPRTGLVVLKTGTVIIVNTESSELNDLRAAIRIIIGNNVNLIQNAAAVDANRGYGIMLKYKGIEILRQNEYKCKGTFLLDTSSTNYLIITP